MASKSSNKARIVSGVRQKRKQRKILWWILSILLIIGIIYLTYGTPLRVAGINIQGNKHTSAEEITKIGQEYLQARRFLILPQDNMLFFPRAKFTKAIMEQVPGVSQMSLDIDGDKIININISDRKATGIWCNDAELTQCYFFDDTGTIFKESFNFIGSIFVKWHGFEMITNMGEVVGCMPSCTDEKYIDFLSTYKIQSVDYGVDTQNLQSLYGYTIKASNDATTTISHLKTLAGKKVDVNSLQYVDVRFPHKIYYK